MQTLHISRLLSLSLAVLAVLALLAVVLLADANLHAMPQMQSQAQGFDALANLMFGGPEPHAAVSLAKAQ